MSNVSDSEIAMDSVLETEMVPASLDEMEMETQPEILMVSAEEE